MDMRLNAEMVVRFTEKEFRLVCLGLAGKIKSQEDIKAAADLNVRFKEFGTVGYWQRAQGAYRQR